MTRLMRAAALLAALMLVTAAPTLANQGQPDQEVPFHFRGTSVDGYGPPTCPGAAWQYFSSGTAEVTHLGLSTLEITHCTWLDSPTTGHFGPGTLSLRAANGDTLILAEWGTFETVVTPDGFFSFVDLDWEVSGGTGRFENASGSGNAAVIGDIGAGTSTATFTGTIAYDASNASG
jgi:hypothetical protein